MLCSSAVENGPIMKPVFTFLDGASEMKINDDRKFRQACGSITLSEGWQQLDEQQLDRMLGSHKHKRFQQVVAREEKITGIDSPPRG